MDLKSAIRQYNMHRGYYEKIYYANIAIDLNISRQAFFQLLDRGGKNGLLKYKERLKEILPEEVYNNTDFPQRIRKKKDKEYTHQFQPRHELTEDELKVICSYPYMFSVNYYKKIIDTHIMTEYMFKKKMAEIEEEKKRLENVIQR